MGRLLQIARIRLGCRTSPVDARSALERLARRGVYDETMVKNHRPFSQLRVRVERVIGGS